MSQGAKHKKQVRQALSKGVDVRDFTPEMRAVLEEVEAELRKAPGPEPVVIPEPAEAPARRQRHSVDDYVDYQIDRMGWDSTKRAAARGMVSGIVHGSPRDYPFGDPTLNDADRALLLERMDLWAREAALDERFD